MQIKFQDAKQLKENLEKARDIIDNILSEDLEEKDFTEENCKKFKNIENSVLKLHYIDIRGSRVKIISSDGTELMS